MNKRIVIIPCFGEGHFTSLQIDNLMSTIKPDIIIYNEGLFPAGPENKGGIDESFRHTFCFENTSLAWDTKIVQQAINDARIKYPQCQIFWNQMHYETSNANECYVDAVSNFDTFGINIEEGDIIFPLEGDVFFHENDMDSLNELISKLPIDSGIRAPYLDFMQNQYYVEGTSFDINSIHKRRIAVKFGTWDFYKNITYNFISQQYPMLYDASFYVFHYAWWRPGKYKDLRLAQLRRDVDYHKNFLYGLELAKQCKDERIVIRPTRNDLDLAKYIIKIDIEHPNEIKQHENYMKKKILIDCGSNYGQGFNVLSNMLSIDNTWKVIMYEPNKECYEHLTRQYTLDYIEINNQAVHISNTTMQLNVPDSKIKNYSQGSTIFTDIFNSDHNQGLGYNSEYIVNVIDIADVIDRYKEYEIYLKLDVEGAEYDILERLIKLDFIKHIKFIYVEFHNRFIKNDLKQDYNARYESIINYFKEHNINWSNW